MALIDDWERFSKIVQEAGVAPEAWRTAHPQQLDLFYGTFALCWLVWQNVSNPNEKKCVSRNIEAFKESVRKGSPESYVPLSIRIIETWLAKGIDENDIAIVARDCELNGIFNVLQTLEQGCLGEGESELAFAVKAFLSSRKTESVEIEQMLVAMFMSARPNSHPEVTHYV